MKQLDRKIIRHVFIFTVIFCFFLWAILFLGNINSTQRNIFFADQNDWFMDFYNTVYYSVGKTPYTWGWIPTRSYLPFCYMILYPFSKLYSYDVNNWGTAYASRYSQLPSISCVMFLTVSFFIMFYFLYKSIKGCEKEKIGIIAALFFNGVVIFNFDRANEVILSAGLLFIYFITLDSSKKLIRHLGYVCLAISAVLKIFPAIFGVILLYKKRYKDAFITIVYGLIIAILPFFWLNGSFVDNMRLYINALKALSEAYAGGDLGLFANNIFFNSINIPTAISYIVCLSSLVFAYFHCCQWKKVLLISLAALLMSGQQNYYCMLYLFYPIVLFLNEKNHKAIDLIWILAFVIIISPLQFNFNFLYLSNIRLINTVCVLMYLYLIIEGIVLCIANTKEQRLSKSLNI